MVCDYCSQDFIVLQKGSGGKNRRFCYSCFPSSLSRAERSRLRKALHIKKAYEYKKNLGCSRCGYNKFGGALEWHHTDGDKLYDPADTINISWEKYIIEFEKCTLLCANCHREVHAGL